MENKLPQVKKEGILERIKNWFNKLFYIKKTNKNIDIMSETEIEEHKEKDFKELIKVEGKDKVLFLREKLKEGQMKIAELSDEELEELISFYENQIAEKKSIIKKYKKNNEGEE